MYTYIHTYTYIYICTYIYTYTQRNLGPARPAAAPPGRPRSGPRACRLQPRRRYNVNSIIIVCMYVYIYIYIVIIL